MPLQIATTPPAALIAGDTLTWRPTYQDAMPGDATLKVRVASPAYSVEVDAVADGTSWLVTVTAEQTKRLGPGILKWIARATYTSGAIQTIDAGTITATAVAELGTGTGTASHAARMVALLEAQLEKLAADSLAEYTIGERTAKRRQMAEVRAELAAAKRQLAAEQNGGRLPRVDMRPRPMVGYRAIV